MTGSIVTSSRSLEPIVAYNYEISNGFLNLHEKGVASIPGLQTTTSYRTGRMVLSEDTPPSTPLVEGEVIGYLKSLDSFDQSHATPFDVDNGHEFSTVRTDFLGFSYTDRLFDDSFAQQSYTGPLAPWPGNFLQVPNFEAPSFESANYYGALAISETLPVHPIVNLAEILGQILEHSWFPELMKLKDFSNYQEFTKWLSSQYVNFQFGWEPFKADVENLISLVRSASKHIAQFEADSSQKIRRKHVFSPIGPVLNTVASTNLTLYTPSDQFSEYANEVYQELTGGNNRYFTDQKTLTTQEVSFSGAYVYYAPVSNLLDDILARVNSVAGVEITPSVLWELAPWSWLADWRWNIGTILSNHSALSSDNLVLQYGYLMVTTTFETITTAYDVLASKGKRPDGFDLVENIGPVSMTFRSVRKERFRATPYGFGKDPEGFSDTQWLILASLGLTKTLGVLL